MGVKTMIPGTREDWSRWLTERAGEIKTSILFSTRLPFAGAAPISGSELAKSIWALPLAGVVIAVIAAAVYALAHRVGLPPWPVAALTVSATLAVTGCQHEDGLANTVDGFGGGKTREQKLAIMREARIGTYGVCALALSILLRTGALAELADTRWVVYALIAAHAAARATLPVLMFFMPPARTDGLSYEAGRPSREQAATAAVLGILVLVGCLGFTPALLASILLVAVIALMARSTFVQIGGQTGDVLGALEQASEIVVLLVALR